MTRLLIISSLVLTLVACACAQNCSWTANGETYDLSPLRKSSSTNYPAYTFKVTDPNSGIVFIYYWNFCAGVKLPDSGCGQNPSDDTPVSIQVYDNGGGCTPIGRIGNSSLTATSNGIVLDYQNSADMCPNNGNPVNRVTSFRITCDHTTEWTTTSIIEDPLVKCQYDISGRSKYACPAKPVPSPCMWTEGGKKYDLSPLTKSGSYTYSFKTPSNYTYHWNFCAPVTLPKMGCGYVQPDNAVTAFQVSDVYETCVPIGRLNNSAYSTNSKGVVYTYVNPVEPCTGGISRQASFSITCDPAAEWTTDSIDEDAQVRCKYNIVGRSKYACPEETQVHRISQGQFSAHFSIHLN